MGCRLIPSCQIADNRRSEVSVDIKIITAFAVYSGQSEKPVFTPKIVLTPKVGFAPTQSPFRPLLVVYNNIVVHTVNSLMGSACASPAVSASLCIVEEGGIEPLQCQTFGYFVMWQHYCFSLSLARSFHLPCFLPQVLVSPSRQVLSLCHPGPPKSKEPLIKRAISRAFLLFWGRTALFLILSFRLHYLLNHPERGGQEEDGEDAAKDNQYC